MDITDTPIGYDIDRILANAGKLKYRYTAHLLAQGQEVKEVFRVLNDHSVCDYVLNYADERTITFVMGRGTLEYDVLPYRQDLTVLITETLVDAITLRPIESSPQERKYSAIINDDKVSQTMGKSTERLDRETLNRSGFFELRLDLIDPLVYTAASQVEGRPYKNFTVKSLLEGVMTARLSELALKADPNKAFLGVNIHAPDNKQTYPQFIVPQGVGLLDLPKLVQLRLGVYATSLGCYFHESFFHIYPLYNTQLFDRRVRTMTFYLLPTNKYTQLEATCWSEDFSSHVLITGGSLFMDDGGAQSMNYGNAAMYRDAHELFATGADGKISGEGVKAFKVGENPHGNKAPMNAQRSSANPWLALSKTAARSGGVLPLIWENSLPWLVEPGACVRVVYMVKDEVKHTYGVILYAEHIRTGADGLTGNAMTCNTRLTLFVTDMSKL